MINFKYNFKPVYLCLLLVSINTITKGQGKNSRPFPPKLDTITGDFCYEINVNLLCYVQFDEIKQGSSIVFYDENFKKESVDEIYKKGILILDYWPEVQNLTWKYHLINNYAAINNIRQKMDYFIRLDDTDKRLIKDQSGYLTFKKFHAKMVVQYLGKHRVLVPDLRHAPQDYSGKKKFIKMYFVKDILDLEIEGR